MAKKKSKAAQSKAGSGGAHKAYWLHLIVPYAEDSADIVGYLGYREQGDASNPVEVLHRVGTDGPGVIEGLLADAKAKDIGWDETMVLSLPLDDRMMLAHKVLEEAQKRHFEFQREVPYEHEPAPGAMWQVRPKLPKRSKAEAAKEVERVGMEAQGAMRESEWPQALSFLWQALEASVQGLGWCELHTIATVRMLSQVLRATGNFRNEKTARFLLADTAAGLAATPADQIPTDDDTYREFIGLLAEEADGLEDRALRRAFRKHLKAAGGKVDDEPAEEESAAGSAEELDLDDIMAKAQAILEKEGMMDEDMAAYLGSGGGAEESSAAESTPSKAGVAEWFRVSFDDKQIHLNVAPPGGEAWTADIAFDSIERIVFKCEDMGMSDGIYVFVKGRANSYSIPTEGKGAMDLWHQLIDRKLFDAELAIKAAMGSEGEVFVWPPVEEQ